MSPRPQEPGASFLRRVWSLTSPYWRSDQRFTASLLLAFVVVLTLGGVGISVIYNNWYREFYNALEQRDFAAFQYQLLFFCGLAVINIVVAVCRVYLTQLLEMRWRTWLTHRYLHSWLSDDVYYRLELENRGTDNPDQRISEDLRNFTNGTLSLSLGLLSAVVTLASFVVILWNIGGPATFYIGETEIVIPGFMVWMALLYAIVGTVLTHFVGRRLIGINFMQERYEADFRFSLVRLRENAEGVALYRGERAEEAHLRQRFGGIRTNWGQLMNYTMRLTSFTVGYNQLAVIFPILVAAPRLFAGEITLGVLLQVSQAFGRVEDSLSWFINAYGRIADWRASVDRLITFHDALDRHRAEAARTDGVRVTSHAEPSLRAEGLSLSLPNGKTILPDGAFTVEKGDHVLVSGPNGTGKSTLFRALAGIWPHGHGQVALPEDANVLFLPQKPYIPIGTLRDAVAYPSPGSDFSDAAICEVLAAVNLDHLPARLDEAQNWSMQLSGGEQQRLALARVLLHRPDWLFLDEATSALDETMEAMLYGLLRERLHGATMVSIAHKPSVIAFHDRRLVIDPAARRLRTEPVALAG
jgi:vitamin B12/bleomycin/antimicrobial peptide transport system ATP-binding/permease protein